MAKGRSESPKERDAVNGSPASKDNSRSKSKRKPHDHSESDSESDDGRSSRSDVEPKHGGRSKRKRSRSSKGRSRRKYSDEDDSSSSTGSSDYSSEESESEEERRRRKRKERKRREDKERKRRRREKDEKRGKKDREDKKKKKKDKKDKGKKGAVTSSWGKYGIIRETDMWNKRPEFTAWLLEVKKVNIESLPNWEEKQMFKDFMEDHNTGTFPSKKYYNLDAYFNRKMEKEMIKGVKGGLHTEMTIFNDEEQRRLEMQKVRERQKEEEVEALKRSMQSGMAQAMKEQARLKEEMAYQYKLGNFEAAAAIQRRLDPDVPM